MTNTRVTTRDGNELAVYNFPASTPQKKPRIVIVHGLGEYADRYRHVAKRLNDAGHPVLLYDQYGHGRSTGPRGGLERTLQLPEHLAEVIAATASSSTSSTTSSTTSSAASASDQGLVLIGHSLGGLVVASAVMRGFVKPNLLVMSSPALAVDMAAWQRAAVKVLPKIAPALTLGNGLDPNILSHDSKVVAEYLADPLVHDRICARLGAYVANEGEAVRAAAASWATPTLLLYAGDDHAVSPRGSREFAASAPTSVVRAQCFPQMYHEIFNEPDAADVFIALETALANVA